MSILFYAYTFLSLWHGLFQTFVTFFCNYLLKWHHAFFNSLDSTEKTDIWCTLVIFGLHQWSYLSKVAAALFSFACHVVMIDTWLTPPLYSGLGPTWADTSHAYLHSLCKHALLHLLKAELVSFFFYSELNQQPTCFYIFKSKNTNLQI